MSTKKRIISLMIIAATTFSCAEAQEIINSSSMSQSNSRTTLNVVVPPLPDTISFASEPMMLDNPYVSEWLTNELIITQNMHSRTLKTLLLSKRYFSIIEPILKANGIPDDFKYLCVAESSLEPSAYSPAKAAGLWQLLATTGVQYKLEVNADIDERYHVEKSTEAACKYLKAAYAKFGSWTLAAASYNMGIAGLQRRITSQSENSFFDLALPTETMRYVFRILSYKVLFETPSAIGYNVAEGDYYQPYQYTEIEVSKPTINWIEVAKENGTTYRMIRELNPWVRDYVHTNKNNKTYKVKIAQ